MKKFAEIEVVELFGLHILGVDLQRAASIIADEAECFEASVVVTPNVDHIVKLAENSEFRHAYSSAGMIFADGWPVVFLSRVLPGRCLPQRVTGADLFPAICGKCMERGLTIAIIGTSDRVIDMAVSRLMKDYPGLKFVGHYSPPFGFELIPEETQKIISMCNGWRPNVLVLALGAPKQELWASANSRALDCGVVLCFGAAVDFYSGAIKRAPVFVRRLGGEWLWRVLSEPKRLWRRYLIDDMAFMRLACREFYTAWKAYFIQKCGG